MSASAPFSINGHVVLPDNTGAIVALAGVLVFFIGILVFAIWLHIKCIRKTIALFCRPTVVPAREPRDDAESCSTSTEEEEEVTTAYSLSSESESS
jgi:hypothetical protein